MKRRIVTIAVSFLLCIGMIGAGFAAWIITGNTQVEEQGTIEVQSVTDKRLHFTHAWVDTGVAGEEDDAKIIFGKHATDTCTWLANDGDEEKLTVKLTVTVTNHKELLAAGNSYSLNFTLAETGGDGENTGYSVASAAGLVAVLPGADTPSYTASADDYNEETTPETQTYTITITFNWGTEFGGVNPLTHYQDVEYSEETANTAKTNLENLNKYLQGVGYTLTITGTVS